MVVLGSLFSIDGQKLATFDDDNNDTPKNLVELDGWTITASLVSEEEEEEEEEEEKKQDKRSSSKANTSTKENKRLLLLLECRKGNVRDSDLNDKIELSQNTRMKELLYINLDLHDTWQEWEKARKEVENGERDNWSEKELGDDFAHILGRKHTHIHKLKELGECQTFHFTKKQSVLKVKLVDGVFKHVPHLISFAPHIVWIRQRETEEEEVVVEEEVKLTCNVRTFPRLCGARNLVTLRPFSISAVPSKVAHLDANIFGHCFSFATTETHHVSYLSGGFKNIPSGGFSKPDTTTSPTNTTHCQIGMSGEWLAVVPPMSYARARHASVIASDTGDLYVFGGTNGMCSIPYVERYNYTQKNWQTLQPLPRGSFDLWACMDGSNRFVYVVAFSFVGADLYFWRFDIRLNKWETLFFFGPESRDLLWKNLQSICFYDDKVLLLLNHKKYDTVRQSWFAPNDKKGKNILGYPHFQSGYSKLTSLVVNCGVLFLCTGSGWQWYDERTQKWNWYFYFISPMIPPSNIAAISK